MSLRFDIHVHTSRYSTCSRIDPAQLIQQAERVGLDGVVITEHHHQWAEDELAELVEASRVLGFVVLAGFEYSSSRGDVLIYGLNASQAKEFTPGGPPEEAVGRVHSLGGVCVAAHPTRGGMGFDERIFQLPFVAVEVCSIHLEEHEQRLAQRLAMTVELPAIAASDAHDLHEVGCYATDFEDYITSMADLQRALQRGRFCPVDIREGKAGIR